MTAPAEVPRGLSAGELAAAPAELQPLVGARVLEAIGLTNHDDLLLVLQQEGGHKHFLHVAPGGPRARVTLTARRFGKDARRRGTATDLLARELADAELRWIAASDGERRCQFGFATPAGDRRLVVELFGSRGLWCLCDSEGKALVLSREVVTAVRRLRPGDAYAPPPAAGAPPPEPPPRFAAPVLAAIDAHFGELDQTADLRADVDALRRAAQRALGKLGHKVEGLARQLADTDRAAQLRSTADLMLAYAHTVRRGADRMTVPDVDGGGSSTIELDPSKPVMPQAQALYEKARRLEDGRAIAERRLQEAQAQAAALHEVLRQLPADGAEVPAAALAEWRGALEGLGAIPKATASRPRAATKAKAPPPGENFRRFVSIEGYQILVGRNNEQNDRLTMRVANGNDLWLHVGGGRPGSHVVIRLPKNKTASLETLLDAGTLAVHFSKARGEHRIEVVYTHKKHVRKPKGLPAGAVVPSQTRSLTVHLDPGRLRRLLDSGGDDADG
ncbi:MAG: DUF814 domain-containing protein [Planctomycetes bacterium]|nr:DUF814 domain-containing protein [Planctomycetota bacterium]